MTTNRRRLLRVMLNRTCALIVALAIGPSLAPAEEYVLWTRFRATARCAAG